MSDDVTTAATIASLRAEVERLTAELQGEREDLAACYKAKAKLIDERDACLRELDFARAELHRRVCELGVKGNALDERNAYAERLLAENVRLSNDLAAMHTFLDQSTALCGDWQMAVMLAVPHGTVWDASNPKAMVQTITDQNVRLSNEAATARERAGVLERAVRAWRDADRAHDLIEVVRVHGEIHESIVLQQACRETDSLNAIDNEQFGGGQ